MGDDVQYKLESKKQIDELKKIFSKLKFKDIEGPVVYPGGKGDIDVIAGHEKTLIVVECKSGYTKLEDQLNEFKGKAGKIQHFLFNNHEKYKKYNKIKFLYAIKNARKNSNLEKIAKDDHTREVFVWDNSDLTYYKKLANDISGEYSKYELLGELSVKPEKDEFLTIPVFSVPIGKKGKFTLFLFSIKAKQIMKYVSVSRRRVGGEKHAYQRLLNGSRIKLIGSEFLENDKNFVNSIIIKLDDNCYDYISHTALLNRNDDIKKVMNSEISDGIDFGLLTIKKEYRSCFIIDGQHRLFSYHHTTKDGFIAVSALAQIPRKQEAEYFIDINDKAKAVPQDLIWDLAGDISPEGGEGIISNAVKQLSRTEGLFKENIKIPSLNIKADFSFGGLCNSLFDQNSFHERIWAKDNVPFPNPFFNENAEDFSKSISNGINNFFKEINQRLETEKSDVIYSDGVIAVLIDIAKQYFIFHKSKGIKKEDENNFFDTLSKIINGYSKNTIESIRKSLSSEAGRRSYKNNLIIQLQESYDESFCPHIKPEKTLGEKIREMEKHLNNWVNQVLTDAVGKDYIKKLNNYSELLEKEERTNVPFWRHLNFNQTLTRFILGNEFWDNYFRLKFIKRGGYAKKTDVEYQLLKLWDYRSNDPKIGHAKGKGQDLIFDEKDKKEFQLYYDRLEYVMESCGYDFNDEDE